MTDEDVSDTHVLTLVDGGADNDSFIINGNELILVQSIDFSGTVQQFNINILADDGNESFEQAFTLTVNDINQAPTAILLSTTSINEGIAPGTSVATISVTDANATDSHELTLVDGGADNDFFIITGDELVLVRQLDFNQVQELNINILADDGNETFEQALTLTVNDVLGVSETREVILFPNPGTDFIDLNFDHSFIGDIKLRVSDIGGRLIFEKQFQKRSSSLNTQIDMKSQETGVYVVEIEAGEQTIQQRWVKQ